MNQLVADLYLGLYTFLGMTAYMIVIDLVIIFLLGKLSRKAYK